MTTPLFAEGIHDFTMKSIDGADLPLASYKGKAVLVVNTASQWGYTPQYSGLESIYKKYKDQGLVVLGVPSNDFGAQEPGSEAEIKQFCSRKFNVTFPMTSKVSVKGSARAPLYQYLGDKAGAPGWNFTKYLVGRDGKLIEKFDSGVEPESPELTAAIEKALKPAPAN